MLGQPAFRGPRNAEEQQRAVGCEGRDGDLHEPAVPDVLRSDLGPVIEPAAHHERHHRPRREAPAPRPLLLIEASEGIELVGVCLLGVGTQDGGR